MTIFEACGQVARGHSGVDMTTPLHSEKNLLLSSKLSVARAQAHALASHRLPVTLTLAAIILSVLGVKP
jgi:hypothetical protein